MRLWATSTGYSAERLDGSLSALRASRDEALARLIEAVDAASDQGGSDRRG